MLVDCESHTDNRHCNKNGCDYAVDKPQRPDIKSRTQFVDEQRDYIPPYHRPSEYSQVSPYVVEYLIFGHDEVEAREKTDYKEEYQWIGDSEEETRDEISPIAAAVDLGGFQRARRILTKQKETERSENYAAENLKGKLMTLDDISNKAETEACEKTIKQVAQRRSDTCEKCRPSSLAECTLDNEHAYRTHRSRNQRAYRKTARQYVDNVFHLAHQYKAKLTPLPQ